MTTARALVAATALTLGLLSLAPRHGAAQMVGVVVRGNNATGVRDCRGGPAVIDGDGNRLALHRCREITVRGDGNRVTWSRGADGALPVVSVRGRGNAVAPR